jgi:hypothetical protein
LDLACADGTTTEDDGEAVPRGAARTVGEGEGVGWRLRRVERESGREQGEGESATVRRIEGGGRGRRDGDDGWDCGVVAISR